MGLVCALSLQVESLWAPSQLERLGLEASKGPVLSCVHNNNHNLGDKLNQLVDIEQDPYEPIDLVKEVMGNDKKLCV